MPQIKLNVRALLDEAGKNPTDLMREAKISPTTAYRLGRDDGQAIVFETLALLCSFFSDALNRPVGPGDILTYSNDNKHTNL